LSQNQPYTFCGADDCVIGWSDYQTNDRGKLNMRVLYIGMYSEDGRKGLESSSLAKRKYAAASIAKAAGGELLDLMYLQGNYDMAAIMELPSIEAASGLLKAVNDSGAWEDMMMFPEFDLDEGLKAVNAVKTSYKTPGKE
jgi:uncharacterized protein with GYD domain